jgi:hypothetical protein
LAVEEQFYFIWPTLILGALTLRALRYRGKLVSWQNRLSTLFVAMTVLSILVMVVSFTFQPALSYFLTVSRAWELSIGALGALAVRYYPEFLTKVLPEPVRKNAPFVLLVASMFFITSNNFGYTLPLIVLASLMVVTKQAGSQDWDAKLLSTKPISFIGNISYSLYLWHWPVFTFATEMGFAEDYVQKALLIGLSIVLATLSYYFVELKFQKIALPKFRIDNSVALSKPKWLTGSVLLLVGIYGLPTVAVHPATQTYLASVLDARPGAEEIFPSLSPTPRATELTDDGEDWFTRRQAEIQTSIDVIAKAGKLSVKQIREINRVADGRSWADLSGWDCGEYACELGNETAKLSVLLVGDSHAAMYRPMFRYLKESGVDIFVRTVPSSWCVNVQDSRSMEVVAGQDNIRKCLTTHSQIFNYLDNSNFEFDYILLSDSLHFIGRTYIADATDFALQAKERAKKVVVLGQAPIWFPQTCLNKDFTNYDQCPSKRPSSRHDFEVAKGAQIQYADVASLFCIKSICPTLIGDAPTSVDYHLTDVAGYGIAPYFLEFLESAQVPKG